MARKSITASRDDDKLELRFAYTVDFRNMTSTKSADEKENWNRRYRDGSHSSLQPDPFLVSAFDEYIQPSFSKAGTALDIAGGVGRHAIWLARREWQVTLIDISEVGIDLTSGGLRREVLDACDRVSVCAFAAQELD